MSLNNVVWSTNNGCTEPRAHILVAGALHVPNHVPKLNQSTVISFNKKDIMMPYMV